MNKTSKPLKTYGSAFMASMHALEALRALLETALIQAQMPVVPRTLH